MVSLHACRAERSGSERSGASAESKFPYALRCVEGVGMLRLRSAARFARLTAALSMTEHFEMRSRLEGLQSAARLISLVLNTGRKSRDYRLPTGDGLREFGTYARRRLW